MILTKCERFFLNHPCLWVAPYLVVSWLVMLGVVFYILYATASVFDETEVTAIIYITLANMVLNIFSLLVFRFMCAKRRSIKERLVDNFVKKGSV